MMPVPVLRYHIGERAILIKDSEGDWGICFGCWSNKKPFYNRWLNSLTNLIPGVGEGIHFLILYHKLLILLFSDLIF